MQRFTATILPIVLLGLATNCDPGGGGNGGTGGAADAGETSHDGGTGGADAGESGSSGTSNAGEGAGDGAGGEAGADGNGTGEAGEDGIAAGGTGTGGAPDGTAGTEMGGVGGAGENPAGAAGAPDDPAGGTGGGAGGSGGVATGGTTAGSGGDGTPVIQAVAWLQPDSCERPVSFEVRDVRYADGTLVTDYTCEWTFSGGGSPIETCAGTVTQGWGDTMQGAVVVRDSATGAMTTATTDTIVQIEPQALEVWAFADNCMEFSYEVDRQYGCGGTHTIDIQPAEDILTPGPWSIHSGILQVKKPGLYTVTYEVEGCAPQYARTCVTTDVANVVVEECPYP